MSYTAIRVFDIPLTEYAKGVLYLYNLVGYIYAIPDVIPVLEKTKTSSATNVQLGRVMKGHQNGRGSKLMPYLNNNKTENGDNRHQHPTPSVFKGKSCMTPIPEHQLQEYFNTLLTTNDLKRMFDRSEMTINIWRKDRGLPYFVIPSEKRDAIRYDYHLVVEWAQREGKEIVHD